MSGGNHTRQGQARGQKRNPLDETDPYDALHDPGSHESANLRDRLREPAPEALSRRLEKEFYRSRLEDRKLGIIKGHYPCWCNGEICFPDPERPGWLTWPGKDKGAPHPRSKA